MKRSTFAIFGLLAILFVVLLPLWAFDREGSEEASPEAVPSEFEEGKELFVTNCGACHTLAKAGTDGVVGPDLDELLAPPSPSPPHPSTIEPPVLSAILEGRAGKMPAGILTRPQAQEVARLVAAVAGKPPRCT